MKISINTKPVEDFMRAEKGYEFIQGRNQRIDEYNEVWNGTQSWLKYITWIGKMPKEQTQVSLKMPRVICRTWANHFANEEVSVVVSDDDTHNEVNRVLTKNKFFAKFNSFVEQYMALGIGAIVVDTDNIALANDEYKPNMKGFRLQSESNVKLYFVNGLCVVPITITDGEVSECAFYSFNTNESTIKIHYIDPTTNWYNVAVIKGKATAVGCYNYDLDNVEIQHLTCDRPLFTIWHPNIAESDDLNSALGTSVFDQAFDAFKQCDLDYTMLYKEIDLGKKVKFIQSGMVPRDAEGNAVPLINVNDETIVEIPDEMNGQVGMSEFNGELRIAQIIQSLNFNMNAAAMLSGLGQTTFEYDGAGGRPIQTATGIIAKQSELYSNIMKQENFARDEMKKLILAIIWANNFLTKNKPIKKNVTDAEGKSIGVLEIGEEDITINFEDNIMEDTTSKKEQDLKELNAGIMTLEEYRVRWYGEDEESAKEFIQNNGLLLEKYLSSYQAGAMTEEMFVDMVYGAEFAHKQEVIESLKARNNVGEVILDEE